MRKTPFVPGEYYHIYNRTILNIPEFKEHNNCNRLAQAFLLANSTKSGRAFEYLRNNSKPTSDVGFDLLLKNALEITRSGEKLVDVLCYAIMPDHYHLLIREIKERGITEFIRKSNISIAKYVNKTKERRGTIFEGLLNQNILIQMNTFGICLYISILILWILSPEKIGENINWKIGANTKGGF